MISLTPHSLAVTDNAKIKKPPMTCKEFLKNGLVEDQLYEIFGNGFKYTVSMNKEKNYCDITVTSKATRATYNFSSKSPNNFTYDNDTIALYLYQDKRPYCENVLEANYQYGNIVDVGYNFPTVEGGCTLKSDDNK